MKIPELNTFSEKTQKLVNATLFECFYLEWPQLAKMCRKRMREDLNTVGGDIPTYHPNLASLFNFYLGSARHILPDAEELNELWRALFAEEYRKIKMKRLEKEIDMSDQRLTNLYLVRQAFRPYGYIVCMEKSNTMRLQPWEISMVEPENRNRYYIRASQAKAVIKNIRMLDCHNISADDVDKALEIVRLKNPDRCDRLEIDLTKC